MPVATSYSEVDLALFMRDGVLKATGAVLGLTALDDYDEAVNEVASALGTIADLTDISRLRAYARREAWRVALETAAGEHHASRNDVQHDRQQIFDHCKTMFELAVREVIALPPVEDADGSTVAVSRGSYPVPNKAVW